MASGKGSHCPACGRATFHQKAGICACSSPSCGAVGWIRKPPGPGGGKGAACRVCGSKRVRRIYDSVGLSLHRCYDCETTYFVEKRPNRQET